jgi:hypothetical protein
MVVELKVFFVDELLFNLTLYLMTIFVGRTFIPRAPWVLRLLLRAQGCLTMRSGRELWSTMWGQRLLHLLLTFGRMVLLAMLGRRPPSPPIIDVDPNNAVPGASDHDLVGTQFKSSSRQRIQKHPGTGFVIDRADVETLGD